MSKLRFSRLQQPPALYHANVTRVGPGQATLAHTHDFVEFFLVLQGGGTHHWNQQRIHLAPGDLVLIRPSDRHWYSTTRLESLVFINIAVAAAWWAHFSALLAPRLSETPFRDRPTPFHLRLTAPEASRLKNMLMDLLPRCDDHGLVRVGLQVAAAFTRDRADPRPAAPDWLADLRRQMENPALVARDIHYWQQASGRSKEHLARACRRFYGVPPTDLLNRLRIEHVKLRLRTSSEKLAALALEAGFGNLGYFYRVFRQQVGCSPRRWRRSQDGATVPRP